MAFMDSIDVAQKYNISRTAAGLYVKIKALMYSSVKNGVKDQHGYYVYASHEVLAEKIGRSESTVDRAVRELKKAGLIWIRRTKRNGHIYFVNDDASASSKNDASSYYKSYNKNIDVSVYLDKVHQLAEHHAENSVDGKRISAAANDNLHSEGLEKCTGTGTSKKNRPTPKRPRMTKAVREAKKKAIKEHLAKRLNLSEEKTLMLFSENNSSKPYTYDQLDQLSNMIADAVCHDGQQIAVNGRFISALDYWDRVKEIRSEGLIELLERIENKAISSGIRNKRAYTLAAVYNECEYQRLTQPLYAV